MEVEKELENGEEKGKGEDREEESKGRLVSCLIYSTMNFKHFEFVFNLHHFRLWALLNITVLLVQGSV